MRIGLRAGSLPASRIGRDFIFSCVVLWKEYFKTPEFHGAAVEVVLLMVIVNREFHPSLFQFRVSPHEFFRLLSYTASYF
jgi:hypothetical protein